jgi:electron transfer flavoprotein alpha subunit
MSEVVVLTSPAAAGWEKSAKALLAAAAAIGTPIAVVPGAVSDQAVLVLGELGAIGIVDTPRLNGDPADTVGHARALEAAVKSFAAPTAVLIDAGRRGTAVAARLGVRLGSGVLTNASAVSLDGRRVVAVQSVFAGAWVATSAVTRGVPIVTMPARAPSTLPPPATPEVTHLDVQPLSDGVTVVSREPKAATGRPDLHDAAAIVTVGRGLGSPGNVHLAEHLADTLSGAVGASRAAVDLGWMDPDLQIGQTGQKVAPKLLVSAGVSGAIQHLVGITDAQTIVAINTDPEAPIFAVADVGIVGDATVVVPALDREIARRGR